ncbi:uncharacterized protein [Venturia canescens]|uniref:uncharacterized protein n=1 Tax=Venturia canescens TaxID=32260 RepID=UPI001C9D6278|nr:uncharacterized protein LOC122405650 [Venturia canescens]
MRPTLFVLLALCLVAACRAAEEEYDYEEEPSPVSSTQAPARPAGRLGSLLSPRGRAPAVRKPAATTSTTLKPVEQLADEADEKNDEEFEDSQEQEEAQTTTTESAKKLRAGGIRPFRSNDDLLAALKRRRAQVGVITHAPSTTQSSVEPTSSKSKSSSGGRSRNGSVAEASSRTSTRGKFGGNTRGNKPLQEEVEETQHEEVQVKPKPYRRG